MKNFSELEYILFARSEGFMSLAHGIAAKQGISLVVTETPPFITVVCDGHPGETCSLQLVLESTPAGWHLQPERPGDHSNDCSHYTCSVVERKKQPEILPHRRPAKRASYDDYEYYDYDPAQVSRKSATKPLTQVYAATKSSLRLSRKSEIKYEDDSANETSKPIRRIKARLAPASDLATPTPAPTPPPRSRGRPPATSSTPVSSGTEPEPHPEPTYFFPDASVEEYPGDCDVYNVMDKWNRQGINFLLPEFRRVHSCVLVRHQNDAIDYSSDEDSNADTARIVDRSMRRMHKQKHEDEDLTVNDRTKRKLRSPFERNMDLKMCIKPVLS